MFYKLFEKINEYGIIEVFRLIYHLKIKPNFVLLPNKNRVAKKTKLNIPIFDLNLKHVADRALVNKVFIWGKEYTLGKNINWSKDYISNYIWPRKYFLNQIKVPNNGADVKFPWELSRFHQGVWLGYAYLKTFDNKYGDKFEELIKSWNLNNLYLKTINWTCAMDVGIRAFNIIYAYGLLKNSGYKFSQTFDDEINKMLYQHGNYIWYNLEPGTQKNGNHYISDLVGLFMVGLYLNNSKWCDFALKELCEEIDTQTLESGINYELSTSYHRLTTELFLYTYIFGRANGVNFPKRYQLKLNAQLQFIADYLKPNGCAPLIGDNDSGHLLYFPCFDNTDHSFLLELSKRYLDFTPELKLGMIEHTDAGFVLYKDRDKYLFFKNSNLGLNGGHNHNDNLSFELNVNGRDIFIDPGTYVYTSNPKLRNKFRDERVHNVVSCPDKQNLFRCNNLFILDCNSIPKELVVSNNSMKGVSKYKDYLYTRTISILENVIEIKDIVSEGVFNLTVAPNINIKGNSALKKNKIILKDNCLYVNSALLKSGVCSKDYYSQTKTKRISFAFTKESIFLIELR